MGERGAFVGALSLKVMGDYMMLRMGGTEGESWNLLRWNEGSGGTITVDYLGLCKSFYQFR